MPQDFAKNIKIDGSGYPYPGGAAQYESEIRVLLVKVEASQTGKALIPLLATGLYSVTIIPMMDASQSAPFTATDAADIHHSYAKRAPRRHVDGGIDPAQPAGSGRGAESFIVFTPLYHTTTDNVTPECVLVHELAHALRNIRGTVQREPVSGGWENSEELLSIFVENMYRSETGQSLRINHLIKKGVNVTPNHLMRDNPQFHRPMEEAQNTLPDLFTAMAGIAGLRYNPFRDFADFQQAKARNIRAILSPLKPGVP